VQLTAVEFFSGIGAFSEAARQSSLAVIAAFDQSADANAVFQLNHGLKPIARNLDSIDAEMIPAADCWWLSPPCKPYTVRGKQRDEQDARARSLTRLIQLLPEKQPRLVIVENVLAFSASTMHARLSQCLRSHGYQIENVRLCASDLATPMRRPRLFVVACKNQSLNLDFDAAPHAQPEVKPRLSEFLDDLEDPSLLVDKTTIERYGSTFDIIDPAQEEAEAICFTSGYGRCLRSSGSFIKCTSGGIRRFSPDEMLRLFGFRAGFSFPPQMSTHVKWRLIGNSVHVPSIQYLLSALGLRAPAPVARPGVAGQRLSL
jgi:site-specific DNA-cytosine methylase